MATVKVPWKQLLLEALESNAHLQHSSFFQLATVGNGRPSNRTVVFKGFIEDSDKIQIETHWRTRKVEELQDCPFAEICWYFTDSRVQFRIKGTVEIVDESNTDPINREQREKSWFARSPRSRLMYLDPVDPDLAAGPPDSFCLLVLDPRQVEYLDTNSKRKQDFTSEEDVNGDKCWTQENVKI